MAKGKLYLIPTTLADDTVGLLFSSEWREHIKHIQFFCVENARTARRFLSSLKVYPSIESLTFHVLDKETTSDKIGELLKTLKDGHDIGIISESGIPAIADPGQLAVAFAHQHGFEITILPGSSSIMLALAASGFNGQQFAFHGYLPIDEKECAQAIKTLEKESKTKNQTQIFIETPFRNNRLLKALLANLLPQTQLCVAIDLTGSNQQIVSKAIKNWKATDLPKLPAIFLFHA
jgi:16S rRNA (cytidine1402-2'-O)-methyltransferase